MSGLNNWISRQRAQWLVNRSVIKAESVASLGDRRPTSWSDFSFYVVEDAYVVGRPAVAACRLEPPYSVIAETIAFPGSYDENTIRRFQRGDFKRFLQNDLSPRRAVTLDSALCLGPGHAVFDTFWHWMFEALAKAMLAEEIGFRGTYLVPDRPYARDSLILIGIAPDRIVPHTSQLWRVGSLYVAPPFLGMDLLRQPELLARLRAALMRGVGTRGDERRRIYISRNRTGVTRPIVNEMSFKSLIGDFGFEEFFCENHTIGEQIASFASCDAAIGSHGAGFTNALFMIPRSLIVELFSPLYHGIGSTLLPVKLLDHRYFEVLPYYLPGHSYAHGSAVEANLDLIELTLKRELASSCR